MKRCKKCKEKLPYSEFYKHKQMKDGHLSFCKSCVRDRVKNYRNLNIGKVRSYDKDRPNKKERAIAHTKRMRVSKNTSEGRIKAIARNAISNGIRDGKIIRPNGCSVCGLSPVEAHHKNYRDPLDVVWLCKLCHEEAHHEKFEARR